MLVKVYKLDFKQPLLATHNHMHCLLLLNIHAEVISYDNEVFSQVRVEAMGTEMYPGFAYTFNICYYNSTRRWCLRSIKIYIDGIVFDELSPAS